MSSDEIRIRIPSGPHQSETARAVMAELHRRIEEKRVERERQTTLPADEHVIIEHEPDGD